MSCGARVARSEAAPRQARKVITVLFSDVTGFTSLSERIDTEAMHGVMERYREAMRAVIERHEGRVERFIGDAVMAVFGLPLTREDDALRAIRAAVDIPRELEMLNEALPEGLKVTLTASTGVNTGEVFVSEDAIERAGAGELIADAVNVAARLESLAESGEVLVGEATYRLTRGALHADRMELELKGKSEPVAAYRVRALAAPGRSFRKLVSRTIGRASEAAALADAFTEAIDRCRCVLATVIGEPGSGKSRLARDTLASLHDHALTLSGRCLPYGEATAFWPLAEIACQAAGIPHDTEPETAVEAFAALLESVPEAERRHTAARLAGAFGMAALESAAEPISADLSALIGSFAARGPAVILVEDIHWAGETMLVALEQAVMGLQDAPVLLMCTARPELHEKRADWPGAVTGAVTVELGALDGRESSLLVEQLLGGSIAALELAPAVCEIADGSPLVIEEVLAMLIDDGTLKRSDGDWLLTRPVGEVRIPPTIEAVLAARLDRLSAQERDLVEAAAVVGKDFNEADVRELFSEGSEPLAATLHLLADRQLIVLGGDGAADFRFHHMLIRDAAYAAAPKRRRAALHERFADYLDRSPGGGSEGPYGEIAGEHLERAWLLRRELGAGDGELRGLGHRAATLLAAAGKRAQGLSDFSAAGRIYTRGERVLARDDSTRAELLIGLAEANTDLGLPADAAASARAALELTPARGDRIMRGRALLLLRRSEVWTGESRATEVLPEMRSTAAEVEQGGDAHATMWGWSTVGGMGIFSGRFQDAHADFQRVVEIARREQSSELPYHLVGYCSVLSRLPVPIDLAREECERALSEVDAASLPAVMIGGSLGSILGLAGNLADARSRLLEAVQTCHLHGHHAFVAHHLFELGQYELLAGEYEEAEQHFSRAREATAQLDPMFRAEAAALHSRALAMLGRHREGLAEARHAGASMSPDDVEAQVWWRLGAAPSAAGLGMKSDAESLAAEALALVRSTQSPLLCADALVCAAMVRGGAGSAQGRLLLEEALEVHREHGIVPGVRAVGELLAAAAPQRI